MNADASAAEISNIEIREITGQKELRAVEELQKEVWKIADLDVIPLMQLAAVQAAGGVLLGAFDGETLAGFAYGFPGCEHGRATHHSHMLAIKPAYRRFNLGYRLKLTQRGRVLAQGITEMTWTFDPLQSLNAYFNFCKLGVTADRYFVNFYGDEATSFLHRSGTDRLWVTWHLDSNRVKERIEKKVRAIELANVRTLVKLGENNTPCVADLAENLTDEQVAIEIPADINELQKQNIESAIEWREATRKAFTEALEQGYIVKEFYRMNKDNQQFGLYLLNRKSWAASLEIV